jgi:hypothetical protein
MRQRQMIDQASEQELEAGAFTSELLGLGAEGLRQLSRADLLDNPARRNLDVEMLAELAL